MEEEASLVISAAVPSGSQDVWGAKNENIKLLGELNKKGVI